MYRGTWLLVAIPLLIAAFTVTRPLALPKPTLPPSFDQTAALDALLTAEIALLTGGNQPALADRYAVPNA